MVMAGAVFTNNVPFHTIYLHGLVRDEFGRKMSKTAGNVVDPLEVMAAYGTDALRFTLLTGGTPGNDLNLSLAKVESNRNFANKIWNVARFVVQSIDRVLSESEPAAARTKTSAPEAYSLADKWILTRVNELIANVDRLFEAYQYGEAGRQIHDFLWGDFADWYVELSKVQLGQGGQAAWATLRVLFHVLDQSLRLLHPFIPFVTEETWQQLRRAFQGADLGIGPDEGWAEALIIADWPQPGKSYASEAADFERIRELVRNIRAVRAEYQVEPGLFIQATIAAGQMTELLEDQQPLLSYLARLDDRRLVIRPMAEVPDSAVTVSMGDLTAYLPLSGMIDLEQERSRLKEEMAELDRQIDRVSGLLQSEFAKRAPEEVVAREREKLARYEASRAEITERLAQLGSADGSGKS